MARIPYRHVGSIAEPRATERLAALADALSGGDTGTAVAASGEIGAALVHDPTAPSEAAAALEHLVRAIAANRQALLPYRDVILKLDPVLKDPWRTGPVAPDDSAALATQSDTDLISVRLDPELETDMSEVDGPLGKVTLTEAGLVFTRARKRTALVTGPQERLEVLERGVGAHGKLRGDDLLAILLPRDVSGFHARLAERATEAEDLLKVGRALVEAAERLVCRLYGVRRDLEDAVVEQAITRAERNEAGAEKR